MSLLTNMHTLGGSSCSPVSGDREGEKHFDRIVRGVLIGVPRPGFLDGQDAVFHGFLPAKEVRHDSVLGFVAVVLKYGQIVGVFTHSSSSV